MKVKNPRIENFLKSFYFSLFLFFFWGAFTVQGAIVLFRGFDLVELLWLIYNVLISFLFLIRIRPSVISMDVIHWLVALITSFSGFFYIQKTTITNSVLHTISQFVIIPGILIGIVAILSLGRSYDFLPALRNVETDFAYRFVRHPMYLSSIVVQIAYVTKNPSWYNSILFIIILFLYIKRSVFEERVMSNDPQYIDYMKKVKYRFIPGIV